MLKTVFMYLSTRKSQNENNHIKPSYYRKQKTILTSVKLVKLDLSPIVSKCVEPNCGTCLYLTEDSEFKFKDR